MLYLGSGFKRGPPKQLPHKFVQPFEFNRKFVLKSVTGGHTAPAKSTRKANSEAQAKFVRVNVNMQSNSLCFMAKCKY